MSATKSAWATTVREILPPCVMRFVAQRLKGVRYAGDFSDWEAARAASRGYDDPRVLERVASAARLVRDGGAAFERDGVAFPDSAYVWPVLASLLGAAAAGGGQLSVVDFGGSLGSLYFQHRGILRKLGELKWAVVEQSHFLELGRKEFANSELSFETTISAATAAISPAAILFSGVLAWVPDPAKPVSEAIAAGIPNIVIARTPVLDIDRNRLRIQVNAAGLGGGSYPCWMLGRNAFLGQFADRYDLIAEWKEPDQVEGGVPFYGFWFRRRES